MRKIQHDTMIRQNYIPIHSICINSYELDSNIIKSYQIGSNWSNTMPSHALRYRHIIARHDRLVGKVMYR